MQIGAAIYSDDIFSAAEVLTDEFFQDVAALLEDGDFARTAMADYLPRRYLPRYTLLFAKQFLTCLLVVAWKLRAPGVHRLACTAEELALNALVEYAAAALEEEGEAPDFGPFQDMAYEDSDFELLFDPSRDGIEETQIGERLGMGNLRFEDWFRPFREGEPVHPYVEPEDGPEPSTDLA